MSKEQGRSNKKWKEPDVKEKVWSNATRRMESTGSNEQQEEGAASRKKRERSVCEQTKKKKNREKEREKKNLHTYTKSFSNLYK